MPTLAANMMVSLIVDVLTVLVSDLGFVEDLLTILSTDFLGVMPTCFLSTFDRHLAGDKRFYRGSSLLITI